MPLQQVRCGNPTNTSGTDNNVYDMLGGKQGEGIVAELHGPHYTMNYRGNLWTASNATGSSVAIPVFATNATPLFGVVNPQGNTKAMVLVRYSAGFVGGTGIAGSIGYAYLSGVGTLAGTLAPISTYTAGPAIQGGVVGQTYNGQMVFGTSFTIGGVVTALKFHRWSPNGQGAPVSATANVFTIYEDFNGTVIVPPNTLWCPVASTAIAETFQQSLTWYETPWP